MSPSFLNQIKHINLTNKMTNLFCQHKFKVIQESTGSIWRGLEAVNAEDRHTRKTERPAGR